MQAQSNETVVASGTVVDANMAVTLAAGAADIDFTSATVPRNYRGHKLIVKDSAGRAIVGYVFTNGAGTVQNIVSAKGGTTRNWTFQDAAFDTTDDYTYQVIKVHNAIKVSGPTAVTLANMRLSTVALGAHFSCNTDLSAYVSTATESYLVAIADSANRVVLAYTGVVGPGEELSLTEKFDDPTFDTDAQWSKSSNWTISGGKANAGATTTGGITDSLTFTSGALYKHVLVSDACTGGTWYQMLAPGVSGAAHTAAETATDYYTATVTTGVRGISGVGLTATLTDISAKQVTAAAATGFSLRNTKLLGGAQSLLSANASFNYNDSSGYTVVIYYVGG